MAYHNAISALSDPRRRAIFEALHQGPLSVADIARAQPVSRPAVSQHLKVLETAGLVSVQSQGTRRIYSIRREGLSDLRHYVDGLWQGTLDAFTAHIAEKSKETNMLPPVVKTIILPYTLEHVFRTFTNELALWWPLDKHSSAAMEGETSQALDATLCEDGEIWETDHKGRRHLWGTFTEFTPFTRLRINWHVSRPVEEATEIMVEFESVGESTKVTLTHSGWEALGHDAETIREGYHTGWDYVFCQRFASACT